MTSALKNRLVGTIIVVALAVIFLPDFLDGEKQTNNTPFVSVPVSPQQKPIVDPEPFPVDRVADSAQRPIEVVEDLPLDDTPQEVVLETPREVVEAANTSANDLAAQTIVEQPQDTQNEGAGWVIQLGSFRHERNVASLLDKLENAGYRAFSRKIQTQSGLLTKVFVGPDLDRQKLEAALPHLKELTDLSGKVTTFSVN